MGAVKSTTAAGAVTRLTLAVPTYRRPDHLRVGLPRLVDQLDGLRRRPGAPSDAGPDTGDGLDVELLVVDNDPEAGARPVVEEVATGAPLPVRYVHEREPGVVAVRNRALDESRERDLLVFVDDDDVPRPGWLAALVATWARTGAQAVTGPTPVSSQSQPDRWVRASGALESTERPDGQHVGSAFSGNLLLDLVFLRAQGLRFDPRYGITGGEDSHLTRRLVAAGGTIVWAAAAVVDVRLGPERARREWVLRRVLRSGSAWSRVRLDTAGPVRRPLLRASFLARGAGRAVQGTLGTVAAHVRGDGDALARQEVRLAGGLGVAAGALGVHVREYRRAVGR